MRFVRVDGTLYFEYNGRFYRVPNSVYYEYPEIFRKMFTEEGKLVFMGDNKKFEIADARLRYDCIVKDIDIPKEIEQILVNKVKKGEYSVSFPASELPARCSVRRWHIHVSGVRTTGKKVRLIDLIDSKIVIRESEEGLPL